MSHPLARRRLWAGLLSALLLAAGAAAREEPLETVELVPDRRAGWTPSALLAPVTGLFLGGPGYWWGERSVVVRTTPPGAAVDLFYVRRNFQKGFEQADAPVRVLLPRRIDASEHDSLKVRAFLDGYQQTEVSVPIRSKQEEVEIELAPLENSLMGVTHLYFVGRSVIGLLTKESLTLRVQRRNESDISVILLETGNTPEADAALAATQDALVSSLAARQLGQDLVVRMKLSEAAVASGADLRQRQTFDQVRRLHRLNLDVMPADWGVDAVRRARAALARIGPEAVAGCAARFDASLREQIEPPELARALTPQGSFIEPYLRAAMKRLGQVSAGGVIRMADGTEYRSGIPLEEAAASSQAGEALGYLSLLRRFVAELEPAPARRETLRGLIAPELAPDRFDALVNNAEAAERACRGGAG